MAVIAVHEGRRGDITTAVVHRVEKPLMAERAFTQRDAHEYSVHG
jgi:hypothetical protein